MSRHPRRREGLAFVPTADGYIVDGGPRREHLTGRLAREALPVLFELMDGTRTVEQIGQALGVPVHQIVDLLARRDLVRFVEEPDPHPSWIFLQRSLPASQADGMWRRLRAARVTVTGDRPVADLLAGVLRRSGVGTVDRSGGPADLTVAVLSGAEVPAVPTSGALLPVRTDTAAVPIGGTDRDPARAGVTAGIAAGIALRHLAGYRPAGDPVAPGVIAEPGTVEEEAVAGRGALAGAEAVAGKGTAAGPGIVAGVGTLTGTGAAVGWGAAELPAPSVKRYLTERRLPLRRSPHPLVRTMAWILAGRRLAPAAAPGGVVRAYLVGDLTGGGHRAYAVDLAAGALVELPGTVKPGGEGVTMVLTGDRAWVQDAPGERLLSGDTGLLIAQLADDARSAGWSARTCDADGRADVLDLDPDRERVTAVLELGPVRRVARPSRRRRRPPSWRFGDPARDVSRLMRLAGLGLARADEIHPAGRVRYACRPRGALGWIDDYVADRAPEAAAVLLFTGEPDLRLVVKAAVAAGTFRLLAAGAGIESGLIAGLGDHDPRVLYGCVLGDPGRVPAAVLR
ncbi:hypothetical protein NE235_31615 [Actinoallomurus spadix]|uniref:hypothetical protein n=1 Tax=Actinoallomurus spadix TaxID=79912 RepID=UPI002091FBEC|nr:hypothetical protein [Actinoallomurus spadix]MCO5990669.1 hypothetical protein [Actinoallomurus spadix]